MTQDIWLLILSVLMTILIAVVGKLYWNHQRHTEKALRGIWRAIDDIKTGSRLAHNDCKGVIEHEAELLRKDIGRLDARTVEQGKDIATLMAKR